nr:hypothetical protein [Tanacetum cinerariifolium]
HKAFPLPGKSSHWKYKFSLPVEGVPTTRRMEILLLGFSTDETDDKEDEHVDDETQRDEYGHEDEYVHEDDEYVHEEDERVHDYVEEEVNDAKIAKTVKGDKELSDLNKAEAGKTEEAKGDGEQVNNTLARVDQAKDASTQDN